MMRQQSDSDRAKAHEGERLHVLERVIVARAQGRFRALDEPVVGSAVSEGQAIGVIEQRRESHPVLTAFRGVVIDMLVLPGQLVREGEPIAWLRVA